MLYLLAFCRELGFPLSDVCYPVNAVSLSSDRNVKPTDIQRFVVYFLSVLSLCKTVVGKVKIRSIQRRFVVYSSCVWCWGVLSV